MNRIELHIPFLKKEKAKVIPTFDWAGKHKEQPKDLWTFHLDDLDKLLEVFPEYRDTIQQQADDIGLRLIADLPEERLQWLEGHRFKREPMPHQIECLKKLLVNDRYGLFLDMGLGKTQVIINHIELLKKHLLPDLQCIVVCPKTIMYNWVEEIQINSGYDAVVLDGTRAQRLKKLEQKATFYIINYEGLNVLKDVDFTRFGVAVLDESSKIKSISTARTKLALRKFKDTVFKYILSGTPVSQSVLDLFAQFWFLDKDYLGHLSFVSFRNNYCIMGGFDNREIIGYNNLEALKAKIRRHSIRLTKKKCLPWLPGKIYQVRKLEMAGNTARQYHEMNKNLVLELEDQTIVASIILSKLLRLQQITSGQYLEAGETNPKLAAIADIFEENRGEGNKFVFWCRFTHSVNLLKSYFDSKKIKYSELSGAISAGEARQEQIDQFNNDSTVEVMIGQIQTGEMGINLQVGNIVTYFENNFSLTNRLQSEDRSHRIGIHQKPVYIDIIYKDTIDEKIVAAIKAKKEISDYLVEEYAPKKEKNHVEPY